MAGKEEQLRELIAPVVEALGLVFWGLEYNSHGNKPLLRVYIDAEQGVNVDDCAKVSRQLGSVFDVEDPIVGQYTLEVSSPGVDRPLFELAHYQRYVGEKIKVKLRRAFEGRRNFSGQLVSVEDDDVVVAVDDDEYLLPYTLIDKAHIIAEL